jgi:hypothetical protein
MGIKVIQEPSILAGYPRGIVDEMMMVNKNMHVLLHERIFENKHVHACIGQYLKAHGRMFCMPAGMPLICLASVDRRQ